MIFRFKQFEVKHSDSLLKVNTDAVLLGALLSSNYAIKRALDIGTGCGIIALMAAQKFTDATIDAIEIDDMSFQEASYNFKSSPFSNRLQAFHSALQDFITINKYDLVFSNPPFFETPDFSKGKNKQDISLERKKYATQFTLNFDELIQFTLPLLAPKGIFMVILPKDAVLNFTQKAAVNGLFLSKEVDIRSKPDQEFKRSVLCLEMQPPIKQTQDQITIYNKDGTRHSQYASLTSEYYL